MSNDKAPTIDSLVEAGRKLRELGNIPDPQEVVIVRPKATWAGVLGIIFWGIVGMLIRGGLISWAATHVSFVPDFGYWESVWIGFLSAWIFRGMAVGAAWASWAGTSPVPPAASTATTTPMRTLRNGGKRVVAIRTAGGTRVGR